METRTAKIADGIFRLSTHVPDIAPPDGTLTRRSTPSLIISGTRTGETQDYASTTCYSAPRLPTD